MPSFLQKPEAALSRVILKPLAPQIFLQEAEVAVLPRIALKP